MARIFTAPNLEQAAKALMHDIIVAAGHRASQRNNSRIWLTSSADIAACKDIYTELSERNFKNIDDAIYTIADTYFSVPVVDSTTTQRFKATDTAKAIVYMAELLNIYWDDTNITPYEIDEFKKTLLGAAVFKYNRYISAIKDPKTRASKNTGTGSGATASNTSASSGKPVGPQSANVRDLRDINGGPGTPNAKVVASGSVMFKIVGDKGTGKNTPNAFVNPLNPSGASGNTNKVKFSSGNGWTDCTCYFDDEIAAQDFLAKLLQNDPKAAAANARVEKLRPDPNGYFLVGTEYGICAISAKKLNEALTESARLAEEDLDCWNRETKNYSKEELEELHTWMRRG